MANKIVLISPNGRHEEYLTAAAITPGHLVELYNASGTGKVRVHSDADAPSNAERLVATEDALQGHDITTAYASGDLVSVAVLQPGDVAQVRLKASENVAIGDKLVSNGDGTLKKASSSDSTTAHAHVIAIALAASNTASVVLLKVRFL